MKARYVLTGIAALVAVAVGVRPALALQATVETYVKVHCPNEQIHHHYERNTGFFWASAELHCHHLPGAWADAKAQVAGIGHTVFYGWAYVNWGVNDQHGPKQVGAKANYSGSVFIVDGPPGVSVPLRLVVPASGTSLGSITFDQSLVVDGGTEVAVDLISEIDIGQYHRLMIGSLGLRGPDASSPGLEVAGDAVSLPVSLVSGTSPSGQARYSLSLAQDWVSVAVDVPTNTPFQVTFDMALGSPIGDIDAGPEFPGNGEELEVLASWGMYIEILPPGPPEDYLLRIVPEPASLMGLMFSGLVLGLRRRRIEA